MLAIKPLAVQQMECLYEAYKLTKSMSRDEQRYMRTSSERDIMDAAEKTKNERLSQGWWSLAGGLCGVLNIASAAFGGVHTANNALKWAETTGKVMKAVGTTGSALCQGGSSLQGANVGKSESLAEQQKRFRELIESLRQANVNSAQSVNDCVDQLLRAWAQRQT
jgi:hypothetical protein